MTNVLYLEGTEFTRGKRRRVAVSREGLHVDRVRTFEEARTFLGREGDDTEAMMFAWEPGHGIDAIKKALTEAEAADLEVVVVIPRQEAASAELAVNTGAFWAVTIPCDAFHLHRVLRAAAETTALKRDKAGVQQNHRLVLELLDVGSFRFRTPMEARVLADWLGSQCPEPQAYVAVLEIMINAIEHGNLGLTYQDKTALLAEGLFEQEVAARLEDARYRHRTASIRIERQPERLDLWIEDQGPGFDFKRYLTMDEDRIFDSHGRGIVLAGAVLQIEYMPPGNKVRLRLPLA